jgi:pimeloyl-ACP methyl ester carboxylesterase
MPYAQVDDRVRLYYEDFGDGRPIVFVHSGAATHDLWEHQVYHLSDRFRTVTYDHRGVGMSDKPRSGYTVDRLADDLSNLIAVLDLNQPTLVSHGLGGHVLLRCVARHPKVASKIALTAAAPWYLGDKEGEGGFSEDFFAKLNAVLARNNPQGNWDLFENYLFHQDPGEPMKHACLQMALAWPLNVWKELARDLPNTDHREMLSRLTQPTLVLHGKHDRKNRYEGGVFLSERIPKARLVTFEKSAHCPFLEEMEKYNAVLTEFVLQEA